VVSKATAAAGEELAYKVVRPSTVTATVVGPDGQSHPVDSGSREPGTYRFTWTALDSEGTWHWNVKATDDLGRQSTADRAFGYDLTLSALGVPRTASPKDGLGVAFTLARPAEVALRVETRFGTIVRALPPAQLPAGPGSIRWDGTLDGTTKAYPGTYVARVIATSSVGTMDQSAPFTLRG
jgi:FlgD Ig-like domain